MVIPFPDIIRQTQLVRRQQAPPETKENEIVSAPQQATKNTAICHTKSNVQDTLTIFVIFVDQIALEALAKSVEQKQQLWKSFWEVCLKMCWFTQ